MNQFVSKAKHIENAKIILVDKAFPNSNLKKVDAKQLNGHTHINSCRHLMTSSDICRSPFSYPSTSFSDVRFQMGSLNGQGKQHDKTMQTTICCKGKQHLSLRCLLLWPLHVIVSGLMSILTGKCLLELVVYICGMHQS